MKKLLLSLVVSLIYISCEKIIPFEGDVTIPKLVINSIFESDSTFKVHVSSSRSVIDTASFQNTLEVTHPNYSNITSSDSLPSPITINSIDTSTLVDPINGDRLQITLDFDDPEKSQNYYLIETFSVNEFLIIENLDTTEYEVDTSQQWMLLTDEVFQNGGSPWRNQGLFNDLLFNGQNKSLELEIPYENESGSEGGFQWSWKTIGLRIYLHNISRSYYYYRISLELYQNASGNPFAQPVQVYSNIENGFGVFAGSQITYFDF